MKRCKKCLLPETYPNTAFNSDGICNYCSGERHFGVANNPKIKKLMDRKEELKKDFEDFIEEIKGLEEYDCLVLLSGGKDSSYLLYTLKQKYGLNILSLSVDTGLLSPIAKSNIEKVVKRLNVDYIFFTPKNDFFKEIYRYFLTHPNDRTYYNTICRVCTDAIHSIGLKLAVQKKIPFVAIGYSPDQTDRYFYEVPEEDMSKSWVPKELYEENFDDIDRDYFWNPLDIGKRDFPRVLFPFHVIEYPSINRMIRDLSDAGLIKKREANPLATNCSLLWLMLYLDIKKVGYNPSVENLSALIRKGKANYYYWFMVLKVGNWLLKSGIAKRRTIKKVLEYLDLKMGDILIE